MPPLPDSVPPPPPPRCLPNYSGGLTNLEIACCSGTAQSNYLYW